MEAIGAVNRYAVYKRSGRLGETPVANFVLVINLANGTTPFMHVFNGQEYASEMYNLQGCRLVTVTHAHYRPTKSEYEYLDKEMQDFVLSGAMLCEPLPVAVSRQIPNDPVKTTWEYEQFQDWCLETYGRRLGKLQV
jgi:hypothetical protein